MVKRFFVLLHILVSTGVCAQPTEFKLGITTGLNMGFVSMNGDYSVENNYKPFPALHLGATTSFDYSQILFETGLSIEGTIYEQEIQMVDVSGEPLGLSRSYDVGSYLAVPMIIYYKKLPLGLHGGIKPKFEAGSAAIYDEYITRAPDQNQKYYRINYLAPFGLDFVIGVSIPVSFVRFSLRYERGFLNRLSNSPHFREYDNQFKFVADFTVFRSQMGEK